MLKSHALMRLEDAGILYQDDTTGRWYNGYKEDVDLTPYLISASMFEH